MILLKCNPTTRNVVAEHLSVLLIFLSETLKCFTSRGPFC